MGIILLYYGIRDGDKYATISYYKNAVISSDRYAVINIKSRPGVRLVARRGLVPFRKS